jgi:curved DNA-binding protein
VKLRDHPHVRRDGKDLYIDLPVTVPEAVRGAEVTLPTFEGSVRLRVPAGAQSGTQLRLRGKGLPDLRHGPRGDLYAVVQVVLPQGSEALRKAVESLDPCTRKIRGRDLVVEPPATEDGWDSSICSARRRSESGAR